MAENELADPPVIKEEPIDPLVSVDPVEPLAIPKEYLATNGLHEDSDCEDIAFFTQVEVDNTRKCLENTRLIIKDFETQLDWHLQQYMALRNIFSPKKNSKNKDDSSKRQDLLSISQLSAIIANHPEGNKKFIKRKGPIPNGAGGRKRRRDKESESEEEDSDFSDEDSEEYDEEDFDEQDSEGADDPAEAKGKAKKKGRKSKSDLGAEVKDEIEEELHELIEPKEEKESDEEMEEYEPPPPPPKKTPARRGRQPKGQAVTTPAKKAPTRGKKKNVETVDLTDLQNCKVVLDRLADGDEDVEIKAEDIDKDELAQLLQTKAVDSLEKFKIDSDKPIVFLKNDNLTDFDFNECTTSNVVITYDSIEAFPEYVFVKTVANRILNGSVKLVEAAVFDQHLSEEKN